MGHLWLSIAGSQAGVAAVLPAKCTPALPHSHLPCISPGSRQPPSTEPCGSSSSHSKSFDQLKCGQYLCSGDATDSVSVTSAGSSSSDVEEINISFIPESPDCQEKKVRGSSWGPGLWRQVWPLCGNCPSTGAGTGSGGFPGVVSDLLG